MYSVVRVTCDELRPWWLTKWLEISIPFMILNHRRAHWSV